MLMDSNMLINEVVKTTEKLSNSRLLSPSDILRAASLIKRMNKIEQDIVRYCELVPVEVRD